MRPLFAAAALVASIAQAHAADPVGCDKFNWPIERERAALSLPDLPKLATGAEMSAPPPIAVALALHPQDSAKLPKPSERVQKPETFAGFVRFTPPAAGIYTVTLSDYAWVDGIQDDSYLKPTGSSGVRGCEGVRKSLKFEFSTSAVILQVSGVPKDEIRIAVMPATRSP
jgi:hypothetical protein